MTALGFVFPLIVVGVAAWVFFDATDRGKKSPWMWALGALILVPTVFGGIILLIIYFTQRNNGRRVEVAPGAAVRLYLTDVTFTSVVLLVSGAATAMAAALAYAVSDSFSSNDFRNLAASALSAFIIGALVWWPHWKVLDRKLHDIEDDQEFRALYALRRTEVLVVTFVFGFVAVLSGLWLLGGAISALLHSSFGSSIDWLPQLGVVIAAGLGAAYHAIFYRRAAGTPLQSRYDAIAPPPFIEPVRPLPYVPPPQPPAAFPASGPLPAPPRPVAIPEPSVPVQSPPLIEVAAAYCPQCGAKAQTGDAFCRGCGTRLSTPSGKAPAA
jgi:Domain of unknown function (DUF5671)/zinc-ribbon domain